MQNRIDFSRLQTPLEHGDVLVEPEPASLPAILTALRQSVGTAVAVLYIAELFATRTGLGYYIYYEGSTLLDYPAMYAGVLAMSLLGLGLYFTVDWMEKRLCPWKFVN